jgi:thiol-disulfide isomerase/thioredoxin
MNKIPGFEFSAVLPAPPSGVALRYLVLALMLVCVSTASAMENVRPFTAGSFSQVLTARQGKPFILVLWSLDCQYCPTELKILSELKRSHPGLDVVLISTDTIGDAPQLVARTDSYGMGKIEQWVFAEDVPERLRLEIDSRWYGEVPRTYFYDEKHQREVKSGLVNKKVFEDWLSRNMTSGLSY